MRLSPSVAIVLYVDALTMQGNPLYAVILAEGLRERDFRVVAICTDSPGVAPMRDALSRVGVEVHAIEDRRAEPKARLRRLRTMAAVIRANPGCVLCVLTDYYWLGGPVLLAGALGQAGAIVRADLLGPIPPVTWREKTYNQLKDLLVTRIVVGSIENRDVFVRETGRSASKIDIIHTGIQLHKWLPGSGRVSIRKSFGLGPETLVIGMMAELSEERRKGAEVFLEMAAHVGKAFPTAAFLVVGSGTQVAHYQRLAADLGLSERVTFAGWRTDAAGMLAAMDVFTMPSLWEGGPMVVLEAMAMGRPTVATRVGMVPEVIDDGCTGLIVAPGDAPALASAVTRLLADEPLRLRMGSQARQLAERRFSADAMVEDYLSVFGDALARGGSHGKPR